MIVGVGKRNSRRNSFSLVLMDNDISNVTLKCGLAMYDFLKKVGIQEDLFYIFFVSCIQASQKLAHGCFMQERLLPFDRFLGESP